MMVIGIKGNDCLLACIPDGQDRSDQSGIFTGAVAANQGPLRSTTYYARTLLQEAVHIMFA